MDEQTERRIAPGIKNDLRFDQHLSYIIIVIIIIKFLIIQNTKMCKYKV